MKSFSRDEIERARAYFLEQEYSHHTVQFPGYTFEYFVLPQSLNPEFIGFVFRMTCEQSQVYGISDSVREDFRAYMVAHEHIEFTQIPEEKGRCVQALKKELELVPQDIKKEYLNARISFFRQLIGYTSAHPQEYTENDRENFKESLSLLEKMLTD